MLIGIDHLVIAVRDVAAAETALLERVGLACTGGGRHEAMGTYNRLAFLGDTYIELIGVFDRDLVLSSTSFAVGNASLALLESGREGLATWAVASDALDADVARLRAAGSPIGNPVAGARTRDDGETVRWITAFPVLGPERPPFLIEHVYEGAEWGPEARATRAAFRHPGGGRVRLASLELPVADPERVAAAFGAEAGIEVDGGGRARLGDQEVVLRRRTADGDLPRVRLTGEPGTQPAEVEALGIRWSRTPAPTGYPARS